MKLGTLWVNTAYMLIWQAGNYLIPLITFPYLARTLGVRSYGEFGFSFALATYFVLVTDWGFALNASGQVARLRDDPAAVSRIFWDVLLAKSLIGLGCFALLALAVTAIAPLRVIAPTMFAAGSLILANVITMNWFLQGLERLGSFATAATLGRILTVPATFLLVKGPHDAWIAALVQSAGAMFGGGASLVLLARLRIVRRARLSWTAALAQIRDGVALFVSQAAVNIYTTTNTVVLGIIGGPAAVGIYAAADRLRAAAQGVIQPLSQSAYPLSHRLMAKDRAEGLAFARKLLIGQGAFTALVALFLGLFSPFIMRLLAGPAFAASATVLRVLAPVVLLVGISNVLGVQIMLPLGMKAIFSRILTRAAFVNLAAVVPLAWWLGPSGTAVGTLLAEVYVTGAMIHALRNAGIGVPSLKELA